VTFNMLTHRSRALVVFAALLSSCKIFDETAVVDLDNPALSANTRVKFHNFSSGSVGVDFYGNNAKMTAVSTARCSPVLPAVVAVADTAACRAAGIEVATGTVYGNAGSGGLYLGIAPGSATLVSKIAATNTTVSTVTATLTEGKFYTFMMSGLYTAGTAEAFVIEDPIPTSIDYTLAHIRLVNALPNGTGPLTLFTTPTTTATYTASGTAVAYKAADTYVTIPEGVYDIAVRYTGSSTNVIARTALTFVGGRVYTLTARGNTVTASTLGIDFTQNQR
jgi:hypothetical protein